MELKTLEAIYNGRRFRIEEDFPKVGFYLLIYQNERCVRDDLHNSVKDCMEIAMEDYGVPLINWKEISKVCSMGSRK